MEGVWHEEGRGGFKQRLGKVEIKDGSISEKWKDMESKLKKVLKGMELKGRKKRGQKRG